MIFTNLTKKWRKKRHDRIYEGPYEDGAARTNIDQSAPKEIISSDLITFSCKYSTLAFVEEDTGLKCGVYYVGASLDKQSVICTVDCSEGIDEGKKRTEVRPLSFLSDIDDIIKKYGVAAHNGCFHQVSALPDFYGVEVEAEYTSGENISCSNNEDVFLPIEFLRELCQAFGVKNTEADAQTR